MYSSQKTVRQQYLKNIVTLMRTKLLGRGWSANLGIQLRVEEIVGRIRFAEGMASEKSSSGRTFRRVTNGK